MALAMARQYQCYLTHLDYHQNQKRKSRKKKKKMKIKKNKKSYLFIACKNDRRKEEVTSVSLST